MSVQPLSVVQKVPCYLQEDEHYFIDVEIDEATTAADVRKQISDHTAISTHRIGLEVFFKNHGHEAGSRAMSPVWLQDDDEVSPHLATEAKMVQLWPDRPNVFEMGTSAKLTYKITSRLDETDKEMKTLKVKTQENIVYELKYNCFTTVQKVYEMVEEKLKCPSFFLVFRHRRMKSLNTPIVALGVDEGSTIACIHHHGNTAVSLALSS
jgi:hypothetical protein